MSTHHAFSAVRPRRATLLLAALLLCACLGATWGTPVRAGPVNLNAADAATLAQELKGVGKVKAQALIDYRQKHGPFRSIDELAQVRGFSQKLIDRNRADLKLGPVAAAGAAQPVARQVAGNPQAAPRATPPRSTR